jgi:YaiO family outer membrane protein
MRNCMTKSPLAPPVLARPMILAALLLMLPRSSSASARVIASTNPQRETVPAAAQPKSTPDALQDVAASAPLGVLASNFAALSPRAGASAQTTPGVPTAIDQPISNNPYKSRLEISTFNNSVNNNFGQWRGVGLHLALEPSRRFGFLIETIHQWRPNDSEHLNALTVRTEWSSWFWTQLGVSGGGDDDFSGFYPRVRYDATGFLKTPLPGFVITGGYTRLYYGRPVSGRIARAGAMLYAGPLILQGTAYFNNARPGNRESVSGIFAGQYGHEGSYWIGASAGGGTEAWQTQGVVAQNVDFTGYNFSFFTRKWLTKNFGIHATYNYSIRKAAYRYNGVEFRAFWEF